MKARHSLLIAAALAASAATGSARETLTFEDIEQIAAKQGAKAHLAPIVRIVSPLNGASVAAGEALPGAGSFNGSGFAVNLEVVTREKTGVALREANAAPNGTPPAFGIRHVPELQQGALNPDFPGLYLFFDADLITPDGTILPKFQNLAAAFNVAGTDDTPGPGVTLWAGWHVLESIPAHVDEVTLIAAVVDETGRVGIDRIRVKVDHGRRSGQALTPPPESYSGGIGQEDPAGPEVSMIAPRVPTALAVGPGDSSLTLNNGALFFIQVSALDRSGAGIAVNETGSRADSSLPVGLILDPTQIPNAATQTPAGPNRNYPGLVVTFDVPLRQPNGNVVPAGTNLAPLFDIVGSELDASGAVRVTADWVIGGSLVVPAGKETVTITSSVTDNFGRKGSTRSILAISPAVSGQDLTPAP